MIQAIPIERLPATSPVTIRRLKSLDIHTYEDLITYFPSRYLDYSLVSQIARLQEGELVTVKGAVSDVSQVYTRSRLTIQKAKLTDETGEIELTWYNQPYLLTLFRKSRFLSVAGKVVRFMNQLKLEPHEYDVLQSLDEKTLHTGRLVPVYPEKHGLSSRLLRSKIGTALPLYFADKGKLFDEYLSASLIPEFIQEAVAYQEVHFPTSPKMMNEARKRLSFDELFLIQLSSAKVRSEWQKTKTGTPLDVSRHRESLTKLITKLPFTLTGAQTRTLEEILADLIRDIPMNRFLQGDVGSGKTIVAALAAYIAYLNGYQTVFMAPTEILAQQHYATMKSVFEQTAVAVALQTGSVKHLKKDKSYDIVVGTHALLNQKLSFQKVALVIIDEQHRFGVAQRAALKEKGLHPHLLTMTATPIPRTVVLTLHKELDLSVLDEMPKGRKPIKTHVVPQGKKMRGYRWIAEQIKKDGVQAFVICPLIEESPVETMKSVKAAAKEYEHLKNDVFRSFRVGLLHGKMKAREKDQIMRDFRKKNYDILVSTSVVEVGIDVPNATIMVIEGADRFGIAQLHQLRGRVGRGEKQSYCFLYTEKNEPEVTSRLEYFARHQDGMHLAEYDLRVRGPGDIYGTSQHGYTELRIASLADKEMIYRARKVVEEVVEKTNFDFSDYPLLKLRLERHNREMIARD